MGSVLRYDSARTLGKVTRLDNGMLRAPAVLTRSGVFEYRRPDGSIRREFRPPEEVFKRDSLDSFALVPVTEDLGGLGAGHPREGEVNSTNARRVTVGTVGENVRQDGSHVVANLMITDADTIKRIDSGKVFLSCGYAAECEETSGEHMGQRYDAIQRNIRGNHVAVVDAGRAGPEARIHLDALDAVQTDPSTTQEPAIMVKRTIDTVEFEVSEAAAAAFDKAQKIHTDAIEALKTETATKIATLEKAHAEAIASAATETEKIRTDAAAVDAKRFDAAVSDRVAVLATAREILGTEFKTDGLDNKAIRVAVVTKLDPEFKSDGKSDEAIVATLDAAIKFAAKQTAPVVRVDAEIAQPVDHRAAFNAAVVNACEKSLAAGTK